MGVTEDEGFHMASLAQDGQQRLGVDERAIVVGIGEWEVRRPELRSIPRGGP